MHRLHVDFLFLLYLSSAIHSPEASIPNTTEIAVTGKRERIEKRRIRTAMRHAIQVRKVTLEEQRKAKLPIMEITRSDLREKVQHLFPAGRIGGVHLEGAARTVFDQCETKGMKPYIKVLYVNRPYIMIVIDPRLSTNGE